MSDKIANSKKNIVFSLFSQGVLLVIGLFIPRITITGYGSEVNGLLTSAGQLIAYLGLFEAGIHIVATQSLYKTVGASDNSSTNQILSAVNKNYKRMGLMYGVGLIALSFFYAFFIKIDTLSFAAVFAVVFFSGFGNVISFFYQGKYHILLTVEGKGYILTNLNLVISLLSYIAKFVLLYNKVSVSIIIIVSFVISLIQVVYVKAYIGKYYGWVDLTVSPDFSALKQSKHAFIHQISTLIFSNTDVLLLTVFCDLNLVSIYSMYKYVTSYVSNFLKIPLNSCEFALGQIFNTDRERYKQYADMIDVFFGAMIFATYSAVAALILPFLGVYTAGADIDYINVGVAILIVAGELLNLLRIPMLKVITFSGHFKQTVSRSIAESAINLTVSIIGVIFIGIEGVLLGTVVALLYRTVDIIVYANRRLLDRSPKKTLFIYALYSAMLVLLVFVYNSLNLTVNNYFDFVLYGFCMFLVCCLVYFLCIRLVFKSEYKLGKEFIIPLLKQRILKK